MNLATDPPTPEILDRKPTPKTAPLISVNMWKMIIGQAIFQLVVTYILYFAGGQILRYSTAQQQLELDTMVFNTFVWMQIFNEFKYVLSHILATSLVHSWLLTHTPQ